MSPLIPHPQLVTTLHIYPYLRLFWLQHKMSKLVNTTNSMCAGSMATQEVGSSKPLQKGVAKAIRRSTNLFRGSLDKRLTHDQIIARGIAAERAMKSKRSDDSDDDELGIKQQDIAERCVAVLARYDDVAANAIEEAAQLDSAVHLGINYGRKDLVALLRNEGVSVEDLPAHERALVSGLGLAGKKTGARATGYTHVEDEEYVAIMRAQQERREAWQAEQALIAAAKLRAKQLADACRVAVRAKRLAAMRNLFLDLPALARAWAAMRLEKAEANLTARSERFMAASKQGDRESGHTKCAGCGSWYHCSCAEWADMNEEEDFYMTRIRRYRGILKPLGLVPLIKFTKPVVVEVVEEVRQVSTVVAEPKVEALPNYLMPVAEEAYVKPKSIISSVRLGNIRFLRTKPELFRFIRDLSDFVKRLGCQMAEKEAIYAPLRDGKSIGFCFLKLASPEQAQLFLERCGSEPMLEDSLTGDRRAMFPELAASDRKSKEEMLKPKPAPRTTDIDSRCAAAVAALKAAASGPRTELKPAQGIQLEPICLGRAAAAAPVEAGVEEAKKRLAAMFDAPSLVKPVVPVAKKYEVSFAAIASKPVVTSEVTFVNPFKAMYNGEEHEVLHMPTAEGYAELMELKEAIQKKLVAAIVK